MVMSKTQTALAFALVVSTASLVWQYQANSRLKQQLAAVRTTNLTPASPAVVEDPVPVVSKPEVVTNVVVEPFDWRKVESSDYREYVANLRAIGCPPATIQDIVSADLRKNLQDKLKLPAEGHERSLCAETGVAESILRHSPAIAWRSAGSCNFKDVYEFRPGGRHGRFEECAHGQLAGGIERKSLCD